MRDRRTGRIRATVEIFISSQPTDQCTVFARCVQRASVDLIRIDTMQLQDKQPPATTLKEDTSKYVTAAILLSPSNTQKPGIAVFPCFEAGPRAKEPRTRTVIMMLRPISIRSARGGSVGPALW